MHTTSQDDVVQDVGRRTGPQPSMTGVLTERTQLLKDGDGKTQEVPPL